MSVAQHPKPSTDWFVADRFGMFIHWGIYALPARHEWVQNREMIKPADYRRYFDRFDPDLYDPAQWARLAREAGMKYFVITTKHHDGFCLWDSKYTDYKAPNTPAGRDLLRPMVDAFRAEGLKVGFYYSLLDWHHPQFPIDKLHPLREDQEARAAEADRDVRIYAQYMRDQVRELLTDFGRVDLLWFDFSYPGEDGKGRDQWESEKLYDMVRELQPHVLMDNRLDLPGAGDFLTPEQFQPPAGINDPETGKPAVWEACQTLSGSWGYHRDELTWKSVNQLLWMLIDGVSKGGNLLLNVGPTARGEIDHRAQDRLKGMAHWMHHHARSIYGCGPAPADLPVPADCRYTFNSQTKRLYLHLFNWPFRHIVCQGLLEKVEYAQFLHDGSEVFIRPISEAAYGGVDLGFSQAVALHLPVIKPATDVPVIELFLKS